MFIGYLSNLADEIEFYPPALQKGLRFLMDTDISSLPVGRCEIEGNQLFALVSDYLTEPKQQRRPEAHVKYIDIQYVHSGAESIGVGPLHAVSEVDEDLLASRDLIFYKGLAVETDIVLQAGMFAVFFPWDVHRPNCSPGPEAGQIRKVVVKVALNQL